MLRKLPANAEEVGLIPGSGRSPKEGNGNPLQYLAWKIPWTEEPVGSPWGHKGLNTTEKLQHQQQWDIRHSVSNRPHFHFSFGIKHLS